MVGGDAFRRPGIFRPPAHALRRFYTTLNQFCATLRSWYDERPDTMGSGFFAEAFTRVGQWGTHIDPPAHFIKGTICSALTCAPNEAMPTLAISFPPDVADRTTP
jgi:hypothetical protein